MQIKTKFLKKTSYLCILNFIVLKRFFTKVIKHIKYLQKDMGIKNKQKYVSPEVKYVEVIVEKGFLISGIIINDRIKQEKHVLDEVETW